MGSPKNTPAPGAGFEIVKSSSVHGTSPTEQALMGAGAMNALAMVASWSRAQQSILMKRIRDEELYLELAPSWEAFCAKYLPIARRTADENISFLEKLGEEFLTAADTLGLGRRQLRSIVAAPPELLPRAEGDDVVIGDERIRITDRDKVVEVLEQLVGSVDRLRDETETGRRQLEKERTEKLEAKARVKELEDAASGRITSEFDQAMVKALHFLGRATDYLSEPDPAQRPSPDVVRRYYQALTPAIDELVHYGGKYITPDWVRDEDAFHRHMQEAEREVAVDLDGEESGEGNDPFGDDEELL